MPKKIDIAEVLANGVDEASRTVYLVGDVDEESAGRVIVALLHLDRTKGDVRLVLCTSGGQEDAGFAIFDTIELMENKVVCDAYGKVFSMGTAIMQACDVRRVSRSCRFMMHYGAVPFDETGSIDTRTIVAMGQDAAERNARYISLMAEKSGQTEDDIRRWCNEERFFDAEMTVELNFADDILVSNLGRKTK
jgi:ATP-dependent protease ClpP protease subunit